MVHSRLSGVCIKVSNALDEAKQSRVTYIADAVHLSIFRQPFNLLPILNFLLSGGIRALPIAQKEIRNLNALILCITAKNVHDKPQDCRDKSVDCIEQPATLVVESSERL